MGFESRNRNAYFFATADLQYDWKHWRVCDIYLGSQVTKYLVINDKVILCALITASPAKLLSVLIHETQVSRSPL